tara:strand:+ start:264 stop:449 length:186 start_codon:yes stop_codon:yes gene_type:complete
MNDPYWKNHFGYGPSITREFASIVRVMADHKAKCESMTRDERIEKGRKIVIGLRLKNKITP